MTFDLSLNIMNTVEERVMLQPDVAMVTVQDNDGMLQIFHLLCMKYGMKVAVCNPTF